MMRLFVYVLFLILAVGSADIVELTDDDFFDKVLLAGSKTKWFVMFDSPWCSQCRKLKKDLLEFDHAMGDRYSVATIDGNKNPKITKQFNIGTYPTFILISGNKYMTYDGPRHVKAFTEFVLETHKFVEAHPIKMVPSKLQLITKRLDAFISTYLNNSPITICLLMLFIGMFIGASLAVLS
ncbi:hypothetical protein WA171_004153, partial [Blastocystis sp. BT1]